MHQETYVDPALCPLCNKANSCGNLGTNSTPDSCWCMQPDLTFPQALLEQVPDSSAGKACICKACALAFNNLSFKEV